MFSGHTRRLNWFFCAAVLLGWAAVQNGVLAQQAPATGDIPAGTWRVRVKQEGTLFLSVRANKAPLTQIAAEISRLIKAPVILSRVMQKQQVTVDFQGIPLESALQMLAPIPYIHYELRGSSTPVCREVFLNAFNEAVPVPKLENKSVSFVMQGDTESIGKDDPLQVTYRNLRLSVKVKKQSLTAVLDRIAVQLGVNFSMKEDSDELVDLDMKEVSLEEAISYFPPTVHLHVRKDLQRLNVVPLLVEFVK
jgi:hypothetical protein